MTRNDIAKQIFEEIRDRPYRGAIYPEKAWNCYHKGTELLGKLAILGFPVRARIVEIDWQDTPVPKNILALIPEGSYETHFHVEIFMDDEWKLLDPSWNKSFAKKFNLPYSKFGADNESCFKIINVLDEQKQAYHYTSHWLHQRDTNTEYFYAYKKFIVALNKWLEEVNP